MGKNRKAHRKKVRARNAQKKAQQNKVLKYIKDQGMTPQEMLAKIQRGEVKISDDQVFGPKETVLQSPQHTTTLTQSGPVGPSIEMDDTRIKYVTPYSQAGETQTTNPRDTQ